MPASQAEAMQFTTKGAKIMSNKAVRPVMARVRRVFVLAGVGIALAAAALPSRAEVNLLNASYDPTRELYADYNKAFAKFFQSKTHVPIHVTQSHGGSGKQ